MQPDVYYAHSWTAQPDYERLLEQAEYLNGILWSDEDHRLDMAASRNVSNEIDPLGTMSRHFWRGVLDWGGYFNMRASRSGYPTIQVQLNGSYWFLRKFYDFLIEELGPSIDPEKKIEFMCSGRKLLFNGALAQQIVVLLYREARAARSSNEQKADIAMTWTPRR